MRSLTIVTVPDPELPIIDPHHHLFPHNQWDSGGPYLLPEFAQDLASGHNVVSTVYVECGTLAAKDGPEHLRSIGEAAFVAVMARLAETGAFGPVRMCEGFVGHADLLGGDRLDQTLDGLMAASEGRLRSIRCATVWDADPDLAPGTRPFGPPHLQTRPEFRDGVRNLAGRGLVYDAWQYYPQLEDLCDLAEAVPDATIVAGHCGGLVGRGAYANAGNFGSWKAMVTRLARQPNVCMKIGGLSHDRTGFGYRARPLRPGEDELVRDWAPYVETCIEVFGAERCMFESNFPVDAVAADYRTLWTVFKRIAAGCSPDEKLALFSGTARKVYRLA